MTSLTAQARIDQRKRLYTLLPWLLFIALLLFLLLYRLGDWPSAWWDEGWYLDSARNWILHGHLGHYLDGQPIPPHIPVRFPLIVPIALSMKLFGIGIWQARLPGAILALLAICLFAYLGNKLYGRKIALAALLVILVISPFDFNPIYLGRQIWAEMSMMFYLLAGYAFLWLTLKRGPAWGIGTSVFFGIAIHAKLQVPPFWLVSIALAILVAARYKQKQAIKLLLGVTAGSVLAAIIIFIIQNKYMPGSFGDPGLTTLMFNTVIFVLTGPVRLKALSLAAVYALPQILGFIFVGQHIFRVLVPHRSTTADIVEGERANKEILIAALWGLGASWCFWYLAMSLFWVRYLFPAFFIGSIFFAAYLEKLSDGFNIRLLIHQASSLLLFREARRANFESVVVIIAFSLMLGAALKTAAYNLISQPPDPRQAANYLEKNLPPGTRVETYDSELFILATDINFHYPSDLVSMQVYRKWIVDPKLVVNYDPFISKPAYLVVGPFASFWKLYDLVVPPGTVRLEADVGGYKIYRVLYKP